MNDCCRHKHRDVQEYDALLKRLRRLAGWPDNRPRQIIGIPIPTHNAIAFNLQTAIPVQLKPSGGGLPGRHS